MNWSPSVNWKLAVSSCSLPSLKHLQSIPATGELVTSDHQLFQQFLPPPPDRNSSVDEQLLVLYQELLYMYKYWCPVFLVCACICNGNFTPTLIIIVVLTCILIIVLTCILIIMIVLNKEINM